MKLLRYEANGEPWDVVRLVEAPSPVAAAGRVVVALEAAPIHIADLKAVRGDLPFVPRGPGVPGFEGVGRVLSCGHDAGPWRPGDRVLLPIGYGAWAEEQAVDAGQLWPAPDDVPAEQLALVRINLATADLLLHAYEALRPGDRLIQNAANSNVAGYVHALAVGMGLEVIDVVRRPELVAPMQAAGRRLVLVDGPDLAARVAGIGGPLPRLALDAIGGEATMRLGACVADGALVVAYGFLSEQPYAVAYPDLMFRDVRLQGMITHHAMARVGADGVARMEERLQAFMRGKPPAAGIAACYPFADVADALRHAAATGAGRAGKVILRPD